MAKCQSRQDLGQPVAEEDQAVALVVPHSPTRATAKVPCSRDSTDQVLIICHLFVILSLPEAISCALGNLHSLQFYHLLGTSLY